MGRVLYARRQLDKDTDTEVSPPRLSVILTTRIFSIDTVPDVNSRSNGPPGVPTCRTYSAEVMYRDGWVSLQYR